MWNLFRTKPTPADPQPALLDDDATFYEQLRYLQCLSDAIYDNTLLARDELGDNEFTTIVGWSLLEAVNVPIESKQFWDSFDWPDHAAQLLSLWRMDREMNAWIEGLEAA